MNFIRRQVQQNSKSAEKQISTTRSNALKKIASVLILCTVLSTCWFVFARDRNQVEAYPFGLDNDYQKVLALNERLQHVVPIPLEGISTTHKAGDKRVVALYMFLEKYQSPMASISVAKTFVESADKNGFGDKWYLLPAISGIESAFGRLIPRSGNVISYNGWGWSGGSKYGRWSYFASWEDAAQKISRAMAKGYGLRNLTPERMVASYCPPCALPESGGVWVKTVNRYSNEMVRMYEGL
ncbi:MAG: hypothetical protein ACOCXT_00725 [Candidatus Dojkabacteria bacterium]